MDQMLRRELQVPLQDSIFWTDSTTVLRYIGNQHSRFKTFVAYRVTVIREHSHSSQWHYVKSAENPADQASRGMRVRDFIEGKTWLQGPGFLLQSQEDWLELPYMMDIAVDDPEVKSCAVGVKEDAPQQQALSLNKLIANFSDWTRIKRAVAWLLKLRRTLLELREERKAFMDKISQKSDSRRGQVKIMRSDNGTNFVAAEREIREALQNLTQKRIADAMMEKGVKWIFNAPAASHHGGVWERQIRTVQKSVLPTCITIRVRKCKSQFDVLLYKLIFRILFVCICDSWFVYG